MTGRPAPFSLAGQTVQPGTRQTIEVPVSSFSDHTPVTLSVQVVHGRRPGPVMFVSAAIHGDEVIGVEIVRRLLRTKQLGTLAGTVMAVPVVNTFGFLNHARYLPDRRDLNRCFPGSPSGSLGARLAHIFLTEVVRRADFGIDLHSAAIARSNLPQIRLTSGNKRLVEMGEAFGAPVMMTSKLRDGSLRMAAEDLGVDVLLYEAGEGLRFDELAARTGVAGILRVMQKQGMIGSRGVPKGSTRPVLCDHSSWTRAEAGGLFRAFRGIGDLITQGETIGAIADPFGVAEVDVLADTGGIIVGRTNMPLVNEGDALFHIAQVSRSANAEAALEGMESHMDAQPLFDEDEII